MTSKVNQEFSNEENREDNILFSREVPHHSNHLFTTSFDREFHARLGKFFALSPASISGAYFDWFTHLAMSPGKQFSLLEGALRRSRSLSHYIFWTTAGIATKCCIPSHPYDRRFEDKSWQTWPYNIYQQAFL